ncbi:MAG: PIN domain-containing protein [Sulfuricella sp.]
MSFFLVDTCGWIEWLTDGRLASRFEPYLSDQTSLIVPTLIQFELYKWVCRERDEATALNVIGVTEAASVIPLDTPLALQAAGLAFEHKLAMADAIILATAQRTSAQLVTSDKHFSAILGVIYFEK